MHTLCKCIIVRFYMICLWIKRVVIDFQLLPQQMSVNFCETDPDIVTCKARYHLEHDKLIQNSRYNTILKTVQLNLILVILYLLLNATESTKPSKHYKLYNIFMKTKMCPNVSFMDEWASTILLVILLVRRSHLQMAVPCYIVILPPVGAGVGSEGVV